MRKKHIAFVGFAALLLASCASTQVEAVGKDDNGIASSVRSEPKEGRTVGECIIDAYYESVGGASDGVSIQKETLKIKNYYGCYRDVFIVDFNTFPSGSLAVEFEMHVEDVTYRFGDINKAPHLFTKGSLYNFKKILSFGFTVADHHVIQSAIAAKSGGFRSELDAVYDPTASYGRGFEDPEEQNLNGYKVGGAIVKSYYAKRERDYMHIGIGPTDLRIERFFGKFGDYYCFRFNCLPYSLSEEGSMYFFGSVQYDYLYGDQIPWFWKNGKFYYWYQFSEPFYAGDLTEQDMAEIKDVLEGRKEASLEPLSEVYRG